MMQNRNTAQARQELDRALLRADKSGMQPLSARIHSVLAAMEGAAGNASEAQSHSREALRLLDEMKKDPGAEEPAKARGLQKYLRHGQSEVASNSIMILKNKQKLRGAFKAPLFLL